MKHTMVQINCDNCGKHVVEGENHTVILQINGQPFDSDWCTECHESLVNKLQPDDLTCRICGKKAKSARGLVTHQTRMHA